jgi:triphosphoribosyl-dephospho-CoA synthase
MDRAGELGVGRTVLESIRRTREAVETNTNLGIVLLLAPMAVAWEAGDFRAGTTDGDAERNATGAGFAARVREVLAGTTGDDAEAVYEAIRLARPAGLGRAAEADVADGPTGTLVEMMALAADRDLVARQYANGYAEVFGDGLGWLREGLAKGWDRDRSVVVCHLRLLAALGDSLIGRKLGADASVETRQRAAAVLAAGYPETAAGIEAFEGFDAWCRGIDGHRRNPGATADLVAAVLMAGIREGVVDCSS